MKGTISLTTIHVSGNKEWYCVAVSEVGTPVGQHFKQRTIEEQRAITKKWGMIHKED